MIDWNIVLCVLLRLEKSCKGSGSVVVNSLIVAASI